MEPLFSAVVIGFGITVFFLWLIIDAVGDLRAAVLEIPKALAKTSTENYALERIRDKTDEISSIFDDAFGQRANYETGRAYKHLWSIEQAVKNSR